MITSQTTAASFALIGISPGGMHERHGYRPLGNGTVEVAGYFWRDRVPSSRHVVPVQRARQLYRDDLRRGFRASLSGESR